MLSDATNCKTCSRKTNYRKMLREKNVFFPDVVEVHFKEKGKLYMAVSCNA